MSDETKCAPSDTLTAERAHAEYRENKEDDDGDDEDGEGDDDEDDDDEIYAVA